MRRLEAILAAALAIALAGCAARAKTSSATPPTVTAPAPPSLSTPQTQVELPRPQTLDREALNTTTNTAKTPAETPTAPVAPTVNKQQTTVRHTTPATTVTTPPKSDVPAAADSPRQHIQEVVAPAVQQELQRRAEDHRRQAAQLVAQAQRGRLTAAQQDTVKQINGFLKLSETRQKAGDMRSAEELAGRAYIQAKELQSGK